MIQETQRTAYKQITNKQQKQSDVLKAIIELRGATLFELSGHLGWPVNRITGRLNELVSKGLVKDSGKRRINPASNKSGIVWELEK